jgi:hypothetical protein
VVKPSTQSFQLCYFQQFVVVVPALASAPFGMPATAFWIYICASLLFIIGLIRILGELPQERGVDKIMPFGRLFFAIPMAVFGSEHFTATADIATIGDPSLIEREGDFPRLKFAPIAVRRRVSNASLYAPPDMPAPRRRHGCCAPMV